MTLESRAISLSSAAITSSVLLIPLLLLTGGPVTNAWAAAPQGSKGEGSKQLMRCINDHQPEEKLASLSRALKDELSSLPVAGAWWSDRPPAVPMTIVTQLSFDRLDQLEAQCRSWHGPISAVAYLPLDSKGGDSRGAMQRFRTRMKLSATQGAGGGSILDEAVEYMQQFHARMEKSRPCQVRQYSSGNHVSLLVLRSG